MRITCRLRYRMFLEMLCGQPATIIRLQNAHIFLSSLHALHSYLASPPQKSPSSSSSPCIVVNLIVAKLHLPFAITQHNVPTDAQQLNLVNRFASSHSTSNMNHVLVMYSSSFLLQDNSKDNFTVIIPTLRYLFQNCTFYVNMSM